MATSPVKDFLLSHLMPEPCYHEFFVNLHFIHVPCLRIVLSKTVGFWILLDTVLAQLPQVLKIMRKRSAAGLSLTSVLLQLYAASCPVVFCMANSFPLYAWGERLFTLVQIAVIGFLILHYHGDDLKGLLFLLAYSGIMLLLGSYATAAVVSMMQASSIVAVIASKLIQAGTNYCNSHTGQLSSLSVLLVWAGSLALIFVSLQETGNSLNTLAHILSACLSCVLLAQVLCYRSNNTAMKQKSE
ncbi:mannose-P-dolichol utilization defect 1 protein-like [Myripristis murdjan]|uniref:Solute carrier family 66 member 3 n=1 Tax=Myripristis murdjan TaxID=586833 RepID=A0A667YXI2_9TELE|nr:mannose-P-dolichol utilization defect 1 protein-like [Myripristis murdjan]